mmetsp:Transcript_44353/g.53589  ORF Transcript_44353/g.53589 Transcript_44353/m.53589 type:complete len:493 (-) Transcript_44353:265-1743(-)|eukprot:CAMPEP_0172504698 /NCGR_PEP_ID=MMETSP1066-20121228/180571_1 /TAXON_ID=671091 /ORGANISM="Coscinodiscus wailesii, Strain CCMP2513" /LENGTH=492 /DNA_ID=CAMNT_0013280979 /DNA_START=84 /DNA_END=1562 /DNA_ORIENTATION=-
MATLPEPSEPDEPKEKLQNVGSNSTVLSEDVDGIIHVGGDENSSEGCCKQQPMVTLAKYANHAMMGEEDCNAMLDTLDSCVACAEGVDLQTQYEDKIDGSLSMNVSTETHVAHALSEKEAALIRLQIMEEEKKRSRKGQKKDVAKEMLENGKTGKPYDNMMDAYNLCGFDDSVSAWECQSPSDQNKKATISKTASSETNSQSGMPPLCGGFLTEQQDQDLIRSFSQATLKITNMPEKSPKSANTEHCAVCFDQPHQREVESALLRSFAIMPCCGGGGSEKLSSIKICTACILLLCSPTSDGKDRVGKCPHCRAWIKVTNHEAKADDVENPSLGNIESDLSKSRSFNVADIVISKIEESGQCSVCNQVKDHLVDNSVCDACYLGRRRPLLYECEQCHNSQRIPHPMYRYQPTIDTFGKTSWTCQANCKNFTKWRILPDQINLIPVGDSPLEWAENNLEIARIRVIEARRNIVASKSRGPVIEKHKGPESCIIS